MDKTHEIILRTPYGRWVWWPALLSVEFIPARQRRPTIDLQLPEGSALEYAVRAAVTYEYRRMNKEKKRKSGYVNPFKKED